MSDGEPNAAGGGADDGFVLDLPGTEPATAVYPPTPAKSADPIKQTVDDRVAMARQPEDDAPPPADEPADAGGMNLARIGTLAVLGAVAANVFGFRFSRWAVGKELHRAWEGRAARRAAYAAASAGARAAAGAAGRTAAGAAGRAGAGASGRAAADAAAQAAMHSAARAAWARATGAEYRAAGNSSRAAGGRSGDNGRRRTDGEDDDAGRGRTRGGSQGPGWRSTWEVRGDFDPRILEELLRSSGLGGRGGVGGDRVLDEMLRAARAAGNARGEREAGDAQRDARRFWEEVLGGTGGRGSPFGAGFGDAGFGGASGFGQQSGPGVFRRGALDAHYRALGLSPGADAKTVKSAYRKLAMQYHPDRYRGSDADGAARRFREITQAYEALTKR